jgi:hypothetical protein
LAPRREGTLLVDDTDLKETQVIFWVWLGLIAVGLAVMITVPLAGR